jgi:epoxyqueuosine reductase
LISSQSIKEKARELGFDLCGIAPAESFAELAFFRDWLGRGYAGEMAYLPRSAEKREDVRRILPGARSVIVAAASYNTDRPYSTERADPSSASIARYAWGDDYHDVLKRRLDALVAWMRDAAGEPFEARSYVDTGPVQERVYAQYAGLGWIGKNTCLINAERGSWLFLSEIICTLALEPDPPALDQCGTCSLCLEACPTGAIVQPHVLDSTRCLSYLTIELRGAIPEQHRPALGNHVYGCDICQEVCPFNGAPPRSADAAWQPRPALDLPRLVSLWRMPDADLRGTIKGTAMTRAKLTGLRRNLAVAIGNSGDQAAVAALGEDDGLRPAAREPIVREHIEWATDRMQS